MTFDRHMAVWPKGMPKTLSLPEHSLYMNLANTVARFPDRIAITYHGHDITYGDLSLMVDRLAGYLQQQAGVKKGDRVLIYTQNCPQFIIAYYATLRADAVVVPVNPMSRHAEMDYLVADTGAKVVVAGQELLPFVTPLAESGALETIITATYNELADPDYDLPLPDPLNTQNPAFSVGPGVVPWMDAIDAGLKPGPHTAMPDDMAVIPYSSGTTGQPKGCVHTHRTVMETAVGGVVWNPIDETDVHLGTLPLFHVTGMQSVLSGPIYVGGRIVLLSRWNRATAAELIKRYRVTRWRSISTMAIDLVNDPDLDSYDLSSLDAIGGGGAAMPQAIAKRLKSLTGLDYIEGYGLSETIAATHINPVSAPKQQCLGIPVFGVDSRILDVATGKELGPNEVGEIITHGPQVFKGYWNKPEATTEVMMQLDGKEFFRTGDLGYYDEEGYFFMVDRVKRMINASGFKVWPAEVEMLMLHNPDITEVCIIGSTDPRRGETVKAFIVPTAQARATLTEEAVIDWCKGEMAAYKCPRIVEFVDSLPKSGAGKVLWRQLTDEDRAKNAATAKG